MNELNDELCDYCNKWDCRNKECDKKWSEDIKIIEVKWTH